MKKTAVTIIIPIIAAIIIAIIFIPPQPPTAIISKSPGPYRAETSITFSGEDSTDNNGVIETYLWKFGDGEEDSGKNILHTYSASGVYTVSLKVIDNDGLPHTTTSDIEVGNVLPPNVLQAIIATEPGPVRVGEIAIYNGDKSMAPLGKYISQYNWYINDEQIGNKSFLKHKYTKPDHYELILQIIDNEGSDNQQTRTVEVLDEIIKPVILPTPQQPPTSQNIIPEFVKSFGSKGDGNGQFKWSPSGIAMNNQGFLYVVDFSGKIQKFDSNGNHLLTFGSTGKGDGQFDNAIGISIDKNNFVYVVDSGNNRIQKFDTDGNFILKIEQTDLGKFGGPRDVYVDENNHIFVIESVNNRVQKFDENGNVLLSFGNQGSGKGEFNHPRSISVDSQGNIYVVDSENFRIQKFDSNGNHLLTFGKQGPSYLHAMWPNGIYIDNNDFIYVTDIGYPYDHVIKFDSNGNPLFKIGETGNSSGEFRKPRDVVVDNFGNFYVTDGDNFRVQIFNP